MPQDEQGLEGEVGVAVAEIVLEEIAVERVLLFKSGLHSGIARMLTTRMLYFVSDKF